MIRRFYQILLTLLFAWAPLVYFYRAADGFTLPKELLAGLVAACFMVLALAENRGLFRYPLVKAFFLFAAWMVVDSCFTGILKIEALKGSIHLFLIGGTLLAAVLARQQGVSYEKLVNLSLFTATLMALYGIWQGLGLDRTDWTTHFERRAFSTLGNPDYLSGYLVGLFPLAFITALRTKSLQPWLWLRLSMVFILTALFLTRVRGSFIALAGAMLFMLAAFLLPWGRDLFRGDKRFILTLFGILAVGAGAYFFRHGGFSAFSPQEASVQQRWNTYQVAWEMVKSNPWFGIGLGQVGVQFPQYQSRPFISSDPTLHPYTYTEHIHNEFLQYWVEGGLPGLTLFLAVLIFFGTALIRFLKDPQSPKADKEYLIGITAGMAALLIQSLTNFPLRVEPSCVLFGLFLAAPLVLKPVPAAAPPFSRSMALKISLALALFIVSLLGVRAVAASIAFRDTVGETSLGKGPLAAQFGARLVELSPFNPKAWKAYGKALELSGQKDQAFAAYQKSLELSPYDVENLTAMAGLRIAQQRYDEALDLSQRAEAITPNNLEAVGLSGDSLFELKRYEESANKFEKRLTYLPNDYQTYLNLGVCEILLKHKDAAVEAWKKAYALNPNDPQVIQYLKAQGVKP
jgi:O-antigen ligase